MKIAKINRFISTILDVERLDEETRMQICADAEDELMTMFFQNEDNALSVMRFMMEDLHRAEYIMELRVKGGGRNAGIERHELKTIKNMLQFVRCHRKTKASKPEMEVKKETKEKIQGEKKPIVEVPNKASGVEGNMSELQKAIASQFSSFLRDTLICSGVSKPVEEEKHEKTDVQSPVWLNYKNLVSRFEGLGIKQANRKEWRDQVGFPCKQQGEGCTLLFNVNEVESWIEKKKLKKSQRKSLAKC